MNNDHQNGTRVDSSTPVVVLGCDRQVGTGIIRSLGRLGVPVYGVNRERLNPGLMSRFCHGRFIWDLPNASPEDSVKFLLDVGRRIGRRSVLIPTGDIGAMFVAEQAPRLREWFVFPERDPALIRELCSKKGMYFLAQKHNVPTPETAFPQSRTEVLEYLERARFPILLKPIYGRLPGKKKWLMSLVHTPRELLERYDAVEDCSAPNVMLQEYVPGGDEMTWTFNGYFDRQGVCRLAFSGRKLRNFAPYFGQASLAVCVKNEQVEKMTIDFMKAIGYNGPLDLGYRYDVRDGLYKVNDINPRIGAMFRLFVGLNGMDVARALYQDLIGQPVTADVAPEGRKWIVEDVDWAAALRYYRDGNLTLRQWLNSLRGIKEGAYFALDDPMPLAGIVMYDAKCAISRVFSLRKPRNEKAAYNGHSDRTTASGGEQHEKDRSM